MGKTSAKAIIGAVVLWAITAASTALAADLIIKVEPGGKLVSVTNTLTSAVTLLFVKGADSQSISLHAQIEPQATVKIPIHYAMPNAIEAAIANVNNQRRSLSVALQ